MTVRRALAAIALWLGLLLALCGAAPVAGALEPSPSSVKDEITHIMSAPPFGSERTTYQWRFLFDDDDEPSSAHSNFLIALSALLGSLSEILLWSVVVIATVLLVIYRDRWLGLLFRTPVKADYRLPSALFGHDEAVEPLPEDVAAAAWELWQQGDKRGCISLLYRGALWNLIFYAHLELPDSATEEHCLRLVINQRGGVLGEYFTELTHCWQRTAYACVLPEEPLGRALCDDWRTHFEAM
jgi:hypothetical protein